MLERLWIKGNHPILLMGVKNWRFLKKLKMILSYDSEIPFLSIYPYKIIIKKDTCTAVFMKSESHSVVSDSATQWTIHSMGFSRPEDWSG